MRCRYKKVGNSQRAYYQMQALPTRVMFDAYYYYITKEWSL